MPMLRLGLCVLSHTIFTSTTDPSGIVTFGEKDQASDVPTGVNTSENNGTSEACISENNTILNVPVVSKDDPIKPIFSIL